MSLDGRILSSYRLALIPVTLVLLVNVRLLTGEAFPRWDASNFFAPAQILVAEAARQGQLLFWNPWIAGGAPDSADPQLGVWSPVNVGLGFLLGPSIEAFSVYWLLVWWWGGAGFVVLGRHLGAPAWGAAAVAVGFVSSGFYVGHAQHTAILVSMSWLPWTVWRLDAALRSGRRQPAVEAGALWGLSALSGYPGTTILNGFYLALWGLGRVVEQARSNAQGAVRTAVVRTASSLLLVVTVGSLILSPAYCAFFWDGRGYTDRTAGLSREMVLGSNALDPGALLSFASPYLSMLDLLDNTLWPYTEASNSSVYLPAAVVMLAVFALLRRGSWRIYLALLAVFMLGCALSQSLPLRGWLYDLAVPTRYFRHSVVFRGYYLFTACILALLATRDLARGSVYRAGSGLSRFRALPGWALTVAAAASLFAAGRWSVAFQSHLPEAGAIALLVWTASAVLMTVAVRPALARRLLGGFVVLVSIDGAMAIRLSRYFVIAWDEQTRSTWNQVREARQRNVDPLHGARDRQVRSRFGDDPNNRNAVAREGVLESHFGLRSSFYSSWLQSPVLTTAVTGKRRFYYAPEAIEVPWTREAFQAFEGRSRELGAMPLVIHRRRDVLTGSPPIEGRSPGMAFSEIARSKPARPAEVELRRYEPAEVEVRVAAPQAGHLLIADRFARGWRGWVDGEEAEIVPACFLFRAIRIPAGISRVTMTYRPAGHPWFLLVGWTTLFGVILFSGWRIWDDRRTL